MSGNGYPVMVDLAASYLRPLFLWDDGGHSLLPAPPGSPDRLRDVKDALNEMGRVIDLIPDSSWDPIPFWERELRAARYARRLNRLAARG